MLEWNWYSKRSVENFLLIEMDVKMTENDDPFLDVRKLIYLDVLENRWFKAVLISFTFAHIISALKFLSQVEGQAAICNTTLQLPFIINNFLILLIRIHYCNAVYQYCYSTRYCDDKLKKKIAKENRDAVFYLKMWMGILQVCVAVATINFLTGNYKILRIDNFGVFGEKFKYLSNFITIVYILGTMWLHSIILNNFTYIVLHCKIQFLLIIEQIENLKRFKNGDISKENEGYQQAVRVTLKKAVIHHIQIKQMIKYMSHTNKTMVVFLSFEGFLIMIGSLWIVIVEGKTAFILAFTVVTITTTTLYRFCTRGETLISSSMDFYITLCNTDWIHWNQSNAKSLLILLQATATPIAVSFFGIITVDCNLIKQFYKWSHQAISLIVKFQRT
uniref:Odorant receptor n=1 Tax=Pyrrhalta maculicollis TaxID=226885 RepID=A0A1J0KKJ5_9CUCU|nr:odorant receptor 21 [Pyrrhalta maculicollis]